MRIVRAELLIYQSAVVVVTFNPVRRQSVLLHLNNHTASESHSFRLFRIFTLTDTVMKESPDVNWTDSQVKEFYAILARMLQPS